MHRFNLVADAARARLTALVDWLYGCSHRRQTFPITLGPSANGRGQRLTEAETYVARLDCGRHLAYDWSAMCITERRSAGAAPGASASTDSNQEGVSATKTQRWGRWPGIASLLVPAVLVLGGFAGGAQSQVSPARDGHDRGTYRLSVNVDLVVLHATVRDKDGRFVPDLGKQDFAVYEDGVRQSIRLLRYEDIPVTVGLVIDHSGSMRPKLADVIAAARAFVHSSSREDQMFVVNFNENVTLGLPESIRFTNRSEELERAISNTPATGQTALYDAVLAAQERLQAGDRDKKVLIVISDGGDNASAHSLDNVLDAIEQSRALVYTIGIFDDEDPDRNPNVLKRLARATGGEALFPGQGSKVVAACERIARDIRHQYTIGYVSSNEARPGAYRAIRVLARPPGKNKLFVRTRSGYIAGGESPPINEERVR